MLNKQLSGDDEKIPVSCFNLLLGRNDKIYSGMLLGWCWVRKVRYTSSLGHTADLHFKKFSVHLDCVWAGWGRGEGGAAVSWPFVQQLNCGLASSALGQFRRTLHLWILWDSLR